MKNRIILGTGFILGGLAGFALYRRYAVNKLSLRDLMENAQADVVRNLRKSILAYTNQITRIEQKLVSGAQQLSVKERSILKKIDDKLRKLELEYDDLAKRDIGAQDWWQKKQDVRRAEEELESSLQEVGEPVPKSDLSH